MASIRKYVRGFSLVELLIVVAIIGVLSTMGVPTFRKMVAKAKKTEAKVALGGIYTVEQAFSTEYNTYGNRLTKLGFEFEGTGGRVYSVGFPAGNVCNDQGYLPDPTNHANGSALNSAFPAYYTGQAAYYETFQGAEANMSSSLACAEGTFGDGTTYTATATGPIKPGSNRNSPITCSGSAACQDVWTMTDQRVVTNTQDGA